MVSSTRVPQIVHLADVPELRTVLAAWFRAEWAPYYGLDGPGDAEADLRDSSHRDALPICLVAIDDVGAPLGTISLKATSVSHRELTPWAAAFLVSAERRRQGIGTLLVAALEKKARSLGFDRAYLSTDVAHRIVEARGWRAIDTADSLRGTLTVYRVDL